jgi:hypothetical protein
MWGDCPFIGGDESGLKLRELGVWVLATDGEPPMVARMAGIATIGQSKGGTWRYAVRPTSVPFVLAYTFPTADLRRLFPLHAYPRRGSVGPHVRIRHERFVPIRGARQRSAWRRSVPNLHALQCVAVWDVTPRHLSSNRGNGIAQFRVRLRRSASFGILSNGL